MNAEKKKITLNQEIKPIAANEGSAVNIDLNSYIDNPTDIPVQFTAEMADGSELPAGISFSSDGVLSGIPHTGTAQDAPYKITIIAFNTQSLPLAINLNFLIYKESSKEAGEGSDQGFVDFWQKFADGLDLPDIKQLLTREVSPKDIYHLLGKFATLIMWNADDLTPADEGKLIKLQNSSPLFSVYEFKSALVATPTELYDTKRGLMDAVTTAQAMVQEIKKRGWNIEMAGYDKMVTAAWVEVQKINNTDPENKIDVRNYSPSLYDEEVLLHATKQQVGG